MIIVFFAGLIIMASSGSISGISNLAYLHIVGNVIGGIMMGASAFFLYKEEARKKDELKILVEKLSGKEEHENEINVLNAIEKILLEYSKTLGTIDDNQRKILIGVCNNGEIKDNVTAINEQLKERFDSLEKQVSAQDSKITKEITKIICNLIKHVEAVTEIIPASTQNIIDALGNAGKSKNELIDTLRCIDRRIEGVNCLPNEIRESVESLITKYEQTVDDIQRDYKHLTEDIEEQEKARTKNYNKMITEIRDSAEESNEEMAEEIKKLAEQYELFEKTISAIVEQMSHMAEEDIKVMKGFLNG